jgi:hypothetical protein
MPRVGGPFAGYAASNMEQSEGSGDGKANQHHQ